MKKIYQSPNIIIVLLETRRTMLTGSLEIIDQEGETDSWVKEDVSNSSKYNVWDDDWSK